MSGASSIEWTDATWNPIGGCSIASPGCKNCYAMRLAGTRLKNHPLYAYSTDQLKGRPVFNGVMTAMAEGEAIWTWPLRWKGAKAPILGPGQRSLIFACDMSDLFHQNRIIRDIEHVWSVAMESPHITQLLTKRAGRMASFVAARMRISEALGEDPRRKVWLGISAERQPELDARWPYLRRLAALGFTVFISAEPLLGEIKLPADFHALGRNAQVITQGESGPGARCAHPDWIRSLRDQCAAAGVAFFFKGWGAWRELGHIEDGPEIMTVRWDSATAESLTPLIDGWIARDGHFLTREDDAREGEPYRAMQRLGKRAAGRLLDGREWSEFPQCQ